jgi:hypothetical protein
MIIASVFLYHTSQSKHIVDVDGRHSSHKLASRQLCVLVGDPPGLAIPVILQCSFDHVERNPDYISCLNLRTVLRPRWIAIMSCLTVVNAPPMHSVRKGLLYIKRGRSADSNFNEVSLINKNLEIVFASLCEDLSADDSLEATALFGRTN